MRQGRFQHQKDVPPQYHIIIVVGTVAFKFNILLDQALAGATDIIYVGSQANTLTCASLNLPVLSPFSGHPFLDHPFSHSTLAGLRKDISLKGSFTLA